MNSARNAALEPFANLIGDWSVEARHPFLPGEIFRGRVAFEWIEGGAFVAMRQVLDDARFPKGVSIFGTDNQVRTCFMLYFDSRGVSRKYDVSASRSSLKWWRDEPEFSQRFEIAIEAPGVRMHGKGAMSRSGEPWQDDIALTYHRAPQ